MKKILLISAAFVGLAFGSAHAGDKSFDGFYLGGSLNYGAANSTGASTHPFGGSVNAGYGKQIDKFYIGGEINGTMSNEKSNYNGTIAGNTVNGSVDHGLSYGVAARAGYEVYPGLLGYGILGVEGARMRATVNGTNIDFQDYGLRYGAGVEAVVKDNWTARTELSWINWKGPASGTASHEFRATVGVGYHF